MEENKYYQYPICHKTILFKDEVKAHAQLEHGHSSDYLQGYVDAKAK